MMAAPVGLTFDLILHAGMPGRESPCRRAGRPRVGGGRAEGVPRPAEPEEASESGEIAAGGGCGADPSHGSPDRPILPLPPAALPEHRELHETGKQVPGRRGGPSRRLPGERSRPAECPKPGTFRCMPWCPPLKARRRRHLAAQQLTGRLPQPGPAGHGTCAQVSPVPGVLPLTRTRRPVPGPAQLDKRSRVAF